MTDALGRCTDFTYEANGNVLTVTRLAGTADAVTTTFTYHASFSQVASVTDSLSHTTAFGYDGTSNLTSVTDREPRDHGDLQCRRPAAHGHTPGGTTTLSYDFGDRVLVADPLGLTTSRFVDNAGRVVSVTDPEGRGPA